MTVDSHTGLLSVKQKIMKDEKKGVSITFPKPEATCHLGPGAGLSRICIFRFKLSSPATYVMHMHYPIAVCFFSRPCSSLKQHLDHALLALNLFITSLLDFCLTGCSYSYSLYCISSTQAISTLATTELYYYALFGIACRPYCIFCVFLERGIERDICDM